MRSVWSVGRMAMALAAFSLAVQTDVAWAHGKHGSSGGSSGGSHGGWGHGSSGGWRHGWHGYGSHGYGHGYGHGYRHGHFGSHGSSGGGLLYTEPRIQHAPTDRDGDAPVPAPADQVSPAPAPATGYARPSTSARLTLTVPVDAKVYVQDRLTQSQGRVRHYVSPPLKPGSEYVYNLRLEVTRDGETQVETREITVRAGQSVALNLSAGASAADVAKR